MELSNDVNYVELTPTEAEPLIQYCLSRKRPFMLHGSPSTAKSFLLRKVTAAMEMILTDCRLTQYDSVDLRGLPKLPGELNENSRVKWIPPEIMPVDGAAPGCLFLDELPNAGTDVQAAAYQLVLDRQLGEYKLPDNWAIAAAGNYRTDMALVNQMASALKNRMTHIHLRVDINDYSANMADLGIHEMVASFLRWAPEMLHVFQQNDETSRQYIKNAYAFHTPRTWEMASDTLTDFGVDRFQECFPLIAGSIGLEAATKLQGFVQYYSELPDVDDLLEHPNKYSAPDKMQTRYALTTAIGRRTTVDNFENALKFMEKMPKEMQSAWIADCVRRDDQLADHKAFAKWATDNSQMLF